MKLLTLLYFFLWSLTSFTQDQESLIFAHGTFTYFAKCKDGVICVSDSRITKTEKNNFGESKSYTDGNTKIFNHEGMIFAFSGNLTIGEKYIQELLNGFTITKRMQNNVLDSFYGRLLSLKGSESYINKGNVFLAGKDENGNLFISRSTLINKLQFFTDNSENYLTNRSEYSPKIYFNLLTMDEAFEKIQEEIQNYSLYVAEIGGKLIGFKILNNGNIQSIDNGKTIYHLILTDNLADSKFLNYRIIPYDETRPYIGGYLDSSFHGIIQFNQSRIENLPSFMQIENNSMIQNNWDPFISGTYLNDSNWYSNSILNLEGINMSKLTIDPTTTYMDFSKCNFLYESTLPFNILPVQFTQIDENAIVKSAIISN